MFVLGALRVCNAARVIIVTIVTSKARHAKVKPKTRAKTGATMTESRT